MIDQTLFNRLSPVARGLQQYRLVAWLASIWLVAGVAALIMWWSKRVGGGIRPTPLPPFALPVSWPLSSPPS